MVYAINKFKPHLTQLYKRVWLRIKKKLKWNSFSYIFSIYFLVRDPLFQCSKYDN